MNICWRGGVKVIHNWKCQRYMTFLFHPINKYSLNCQSFADFFLTVQLYCISGMSAGSPWTQNAPQIPVGIPPSPPPSRDGPGRGKLPPIPPYGKWIYVHYYTRVWWIPGLGAHLPPVQKMPVQFSFSIRFCVKSVQIYYNTKMSKNRPPNWATKKPHQKWN